VSFLDPEVTPRLFHMVRAANVERDGGHSPDGLPAASGSRRNPRGFASRRYLVTHRIKEAGIAH
jgi:hypothetical protein